MYALYGLYRLYALRMDLNNRCVASCIRAGKRYRWQARSPTRAPSTIYCHAGHPAAAGSCGVDMPAGAKSRGKTLSYELPWFMVVGSPGDGKTTALLNTGLRSRWRSKWSSTSRIPTVPGGGTPHRDWWFTNEAVLIDTAGRYALPRRPVCCANIAPARRLTARILTLNVADFNRTAVTGGTPGGLRRLRDWQNCARPGIFASLGLSGNTKMDLLPGFQREYFARRPAIFAHKIWGLYVAAQPQAKNGRPAGADTPARRSFGAPDAAVDHQGPDTRLQEE